MRYGPDAPLPLTTTSAIQQADGILTCVTDDPACLSFRDSVFHIAQRSQSRIGHMPGVTLEMLPMADADYPQIQADGELLACALLKGHELELISYDAQGKVHHLAAGLGGWRRPPALSSGVIKRGGWANIPPGETFIAPLEGSGRGRVVISGSLPGYVIRRGGEVILEFERGRLTRFWSEDARCLEILAGLRDFAAGRQDPNWGNLAEVGLGLNPAVELTGIELLDEKKYGTAHIALGENNWFGGTVASAIHSDLIILNPEVRIDGRPIVCQGRIVAQWSDWQEDHREIEVDPAWRAGVARLSRSGVQGDRTLGLLRREWIDGRGDSYYLQVGSAESARKAAYLYGQIPPVPTRIETVALLSHNVDLDEEEVWQLVRLMAAYELLEVS
jgi:hypothetical protein